MAYIETLFDRFGMAPKMVGAGLMLLWGISFSSAMAFAKTLDPEIHSFVLLFIRCAFGLMVFAPFAMSAGIESVKTRRPFLHLLRIGFLIGAMTCTYYAYRNLPLATATSIGMTGPLFTTLLSIVLLQDHVSWQKWAVILFGYLGVVVMVRPDVMPVDFAVWVEILANVFAALSIITVKMLSRTEKSITILIYANIVTCLVGAALAASVWQTPSADDMMALFFIGALGALSQFCSVNALKYANPSFLAPFEYTRLVFAIPLGFWIFGEVPTLWTFLGTLMIVVATYGLTRIEALRSNP